MNRLTISTWSIGISLLMLFLASSPAEASHTQPKPKRHDCSAYGKVKWMVWKDFAYLYYTNRTQSDVIISYIDWTGK